ncbi:hypothetical protein D6777_01115, partial [Candidatus Woesearchaeota archaeon]
RLYLNRGTGGTTGKPVGFFWTQGDWRASVEAMVRGMSDVKIKMPLMAFNGYNQGHIAGPIFDWTIRMLGGVSVPRHFKSNEEQAVEQMREYKCNCLIATPQSGSGKGGSLMDFLDIDNGEYINGENVQLYLCSSTPLTDELISELEDLGIKQIVNFYGSTDALPTAISCQADKKALHVMQGHIFLEVVDENGKHVKNGERGRVVVTRIGGSSDNGIDVCKGTQLIRFFVGDEATYVEDKCACGKTTPRIKDIKRVSYLEDKSQGGCEIW